MITHYMPRILSLVLMKALLSIFQPVPDLHPAISSTILLLIQETRIVASFRSKTIGSFQILISVILAAGRRRTEKNERKDNIIGDQRDWFELNMRASSTGTKNWLESLEAILVFVVPLLFALPLYVLGVLTEVSGNYVMYAVYITCSIALTEYNGRSLRDMGLTRKELLPSLGLSGVTVLASFLVRLISAELQFSPEANSGVAVAQGLLFWTVSGFGQEILFRGLIFFSFYRWKGWKTALLVSSLLFGLMHVNQGITGIVFTILIGGYWGWVAFKTKNIIGTSIAHSLFNFFFTFLFAS